jgi:MerR family transcriptional regulator, light-induced transcriptional regulator
VAASCQAVVEPLVQSFYSVAVEEAAGHLRIGQLSRRTGVSPELLRAWERRYGLLEPTRSPGGFRLYSDADEARVRRMQAHLARGVSAAQAARLAERTGSRVPEAGSLALLAESLRSSLDAFDEAGAHRVLDRALASFTLDAVISDLLLPYLHELGDRWESGDVSVAHEHFASQLIRTRMLALARSWDLGSGPRALLACPEGELHDLGLALFGVALAQRGWRITFLGANTPLATIASTADQVDAELVVIAASNAEFVRPIVDGLAELARSHRVAIGGRGAEAVSIEGAEALRADPVESAQQLAGG